MGPRSYLAKNLVSIIRYTWTHLFPDDELFPQTELVGFPFLLYVNVLVDSIVYLPCESQVIQALHRRRYHMMKYTVM